MLKIAHIAPDQKFIDSALDAFELAYPGQNEFYITTPEPWKHLKKRKEYKSLGKKKLLEFILLNRSDFKSYDVVILHSLNINYLVLMVCLKQRYVWIGWGFDYYWRSFNSVNSEHAYLLPKTRDLSNLNREKFQRRSLHEKIIGSKFFFNLAMRNLKVFSPVLPDEFKMVSQKYSLAESVKHFPWNYGFLETHWTKGIKTDGINDANSILLGNSATPTNNHIEALDSILASGVERDVYVPLGYGEADYSLSVKKYINKNEQLRKQCKILDSYMPIEEYNSILNSCGFVIMNHCRQQAVGNIIAMLYRGAKVFLREESLVYKFFKENNAKIFTVQELELSPKLLDNSLNVVDIANNRKVLEQFWSERVIVKRTKMLVEGAIN